MENLFRFITPETTNAIFNHVRNLLICGFLFALGVYAAKDTSPFFGIIRIGSGSGIILVASILTLINFVDGAKRLLRLEYGTLLTALLGLFYVLISLRIIYLSLFFRIQ